MPWLAAGGLAVIPYDKHEGTHEPVARGGHAAHYALLIGYAARKGDVRIVGVHGLSRRPLVSTAGALCASNAGLVEMKRSVNTSKWVVGDAGIRLARRVLLLARHTQTHATTPPPA